MLQRWRIEYKLSYRCVTLRVVWRAIVTFWGWNLKTGMTESRSMTAWTQRYLVCQNRPRNGFRKLFLVRCNTEKVLHLWSMRARLHVRAWAAVLPWSLGSWKQSWVLQMIVFHFLVGLNLTLSLSWRPWACIRELTHHMRPVWKMPRCFKIELFIHFLDLYDIRLLPSVVTFPDVQ